MKKNLLLLSFAALMCSSVAKAQSPEAIYMATWSTMGELGTTITPNADDPKLTYNSETGCYEGQIIDWPRLAVNPYIAKIPYSVSENVIKYYGVAGATQSFSFNTNDSQAFEFTVSTNPSSYKGFALSIQNNTGVADVKISMNLSTKTITFTKFESGLGTTIPTLVSVNPENGSEIVLNEDGSATIILTFSGEVTSMEAICDGVLLHAVPNSEGDEWTVTVPAGNVTSSVSESDGKLSLRIQKVYYGNMPVTFENGNGVLFLNYPVAGFAGINKIADENSDYNIYTLGGSLVLKTKNADELNNLPQGIYIVNGKKLVIK